MNNEKLLYTEEYFSQQGLAGIKRDFFYAVAVQILKGNFFYPVINFMEALTAEKYPNRIKNKC